jgi:hypothetical protein
MTFDIDIDAPGFGVFNQSYFILTEVSFRMLTMCCVFVIAPLAASTSAYAASTAAAPPSEADARPTAPLARKVVTAAV